MANPALYHFLMRIRPFTGRYVLLLICIAAFIWYAQYSRTIIMQLQDEALSVTQTYAELIRTAITERMNNEEMNVIFEEIIRKSNIPVIITDTSWTPLMWRNVVVGPFFHRQEVPTHDTGAAAVAKVRRKLAEFKNIYAPKVLYISETKTKIGYLAFGNSELIGSLSRMPYIEVGLVAAFVFFAFLGFHNIQVTERSNLWVGLAKETAHQLGTPISSLMGWIEYIKSAGSQDEPVDPEEYVKQVHTVCENMETDLSRLRKVTSRFSQIGSVPALTKCDLNAVLNDAAAYFRMRLPLLGKHIEIKLTCGGLPFIAANRHLIEWVFENLLKNSVDAITKPDGEIEITTQYLENDRVVRITHADNGKGISWEDQKKIFAPGFTTKKRGWGLGLTLAKRIVEDYHKGKIYLAFSQKDKGTVFCIDLPVGSDKRKHAKPSQDDDLKPPAPRGHDNLNSPKEINS
jgi:signal transduction histidine kinase